MNSKDKVVVRSRDQKTALPLTSIDFSSFQTTWEKNNSYQVAFTAFDDGSLSFNLLLVENSIFWNGQEYIIKQATDDYSGGNHTIQITATHVFYQLNSIRQNDVRKGDYSANLQDFLGFLTSVAPAYTFNIVGDLNSSQTLSDFGNCSVSDGLSTLATNFNVYAIVPDGYTVNLYSEESFTHDVGKSFFYQNNSSEVQLQYDSSTIVNRVQVVSSADTPEFSPFYVTDDASIAQWGTRDGERVDVDKDKGQDVGTTTAQHKLVPTPALTLTVTAQIQTVDKGDIWTLVIPESNITTKVQVVSIVNTPFLPNNIQVTLNNTMQNFLDSFNANSKKLAFIQAQKNQSNSSFNMWTVGKVVDNG